MNNSEKINVAKTGWIELGWFGNFYQIVVEAFRAFFGEKGITQEIIGWCCGEFGKTILLKGLKVCCEMVYKGYELWRCNQLTFMSMVDAFIVNERKVVEISILFANSRTVACSQDFLRAFGSLSSGCGFENLCVWKIKKFNLSEEEFQDHIGGLDIKPHIVELVQAIEGGLMNDTGIHFLAYANDHVSFHPEPVIIITPPSKGDGKWQFHLMREEVLPREEISSDVLVITKQP